MKQINPIGQCNTATPLYHVILQKYRNAFGFVEQQPTHRRSPTIVSHAARCASMPDGLLRVLGPQKDNFQALCTPFLRVNPTFRLYFSVVKMWTSTILARFRSLGPTPEPKKCAKQMEGCGSMATVGRVKLAKVAFSLPNALDKQTPPSE